ncbi:flagellar hook assembly protein FlgD [Afifella sp. IM 167]|uniref:flagellar hook assembly protein FlgD n=1 Tax=Afifella sp. IM 167 TaxID=2033586 RepID=UPI001CCCBEA4|nr:flagellar hook assembly protein FlgD [Afifella sp. IM 167]MBZ8131802.1 flagellar basal body rod modification protein [Afifella sp. IM 167]
MTSTSGVSGGASTAGQSATSGTTATTDYDAFLKLLVTQLKNQDPTKPMDSTEYMAQLATFSQVEQSITTNTKLDSLLTSSAIEQANQMIGRTLTSADGSVSGEVKSVRIVSGGLVANLADGSQLEVGAGTVVS